MSNGSQENGVDSVVMYEAMAMHSSAIDVSGRALDPPGVKSPMDSVNSSITASGNLTVDCCSKISFPGDACEAKSGQFVDTVDNSVVNNCSWLDKLDTGSNINEHNDTVTGTAATQFTNCSGCSQQSDSCPDSAVYDVACYPTKLGSISECQSSSLCEDGNQVSLSDSTRASWGEAAVNNMSDAASSSVSCSSVSLKNGLSLSQSHMDKISSVGMCLDETRCSPSISEPYVASGLLDAESVYKAESGDVGEEIEKTLPDISGKDKNSVNADADFECNSGQNSDSSICKNQEVSNAEDSFNHISIDFVIGDEFSFIQPDDKITGSCDILQSFTSAHHLDNADTPLTTSRFLTDDCTDDSSLSAKEKIDNRVEVAEEQRPSSPMSRISSDANQGSPKKCVQLNVNSDPKLNYHVFVKIERLKLPLSYPVPCSNYYDVKQIKTNLNNHLEDTDENIGSCNVFRPADSAEDKSCQLSVSFEDSDSNPPSPNYLKTLDFLGLNNEDGSFQETSSQMDETLSKVDRCSTPEPARQPEGEKSISSQSSSSQQDAAVCSDFNALAMTTLNDRRHQLNSVVQHSKTDFTAYNPLLVSSALCETVAESSVSLSHPKHQAGKSISVTAKSSCYQYLNDVRYQPFVKLVRLPLEFFQIVMASRQAELDQIQRVRQQSTFDITQYTARGKGKHADRFEKAAEKTKERTSQQKSKKRVLSDSDSDNETPLPSKRSKSVESCSGSTGKKDLKDNYVWKLDRLKESLAKSPDKSDKMVTDNERTISKEIASSNNPDKKTEECSKTVSDKDEENKSSRKEKVKAVKAASHVNKSEVSADRNHPVAESMKTNESESPVELSSKARSAEVTSTQDNARTERARHSGTKNLGNKDAKTRMVTVSDSNKTKLGSLNSAKTDTQKSRAIDAERKKSAEDHKSGGFIIPKVAKRVDVKVECNLGSPLSVLESQRKMSEEQKRKAILPKSLGDQNKHAKSLAGRPGIVSKPPLAAAAADRQNRMQKSLVKVPVKPCDNSSLSVLDMIEKHPGYVVRPEHNMSNKGGSVAKLSGLEPQVSPASGAPIPTLSGRRDYNSRQNKPFNQSNAVIGGHTSNIMTIGNTEMPEMDERLVTASSTNGVFIPDCQVLANAPSDSSVSYAGLGTPSGLSISVSSVSYTAPGRLGTMPLDVSSRFNVDQKVSTIDQDDFSMSFDDSPELSDTSSPHLTFRTPASSCIPPGSSNPFSSMKITSCLTNYPPSSGYPPVPLLGPPQGYPNMLGMPPPPVVPPAGFPNMYPPMRMFPPPVIIPAESYLKTYPSPSPVVPPAVVPPSGIPPPQLPPVSHYSCVPHVPQVAHVALMSEESETETQSRKTPLLPTPVNPLPSTTACHKSPPANPPVSGLLPILDMNRQEIQGAGLQLEVVTSRPSLLGRAPALLGDRPSLLGSGPLSSNHTHPGSGGSGSMTTDVIKVPKTSSIPQDNLLKGLGDLLSQFGELKHLPDDDQEIELENYIGWLSEACLKIADGRPLSPQFHDRLQKLMDSLAQSLNDSDEQPAKNCGRLSEASVERKLDSKPPIPSLLDLDLRREYQHENNDNVNSTIKTRPVAEVVGDQRFSQVAGENTEMSYSMIKISDFSNPQVYRDVLPSDIGEVRPRMPSSSQISFTEQLMEVFVASGCSRESARNLITTAQSMCQAEGQMPNDSSHGKKIIASPRMGSGSGGTAATVVEHFRRVDDEFTGMETRRSPILPFTGFQGSGNTSVKPIKPGYVSVGNSSRDAVSGTNHYVNQALRPMSGNEFVESTKDYRNEVTPYLAFRGSVPREVNAGVVDSSHYSTGPDHSQRSSSLDREFLMKSVPLTASEILAKKIHDELQLCDVLVKIQSELAGIYDLTTDESASPSDKDMKDILLPENLSMSFMGKNVVFPLHSALVTQCSKGNNASKMDMGDSFVSAISTSPAAVVRSSPAQTVGGLTLKGKQVHSRVDVAERLSASGRIDRKNYETKESSSGQSIPVRILFNSPSSVPINSGQGAKTSNIVSNPELKTMQVPRIVTSPHTPVVNPINQMSSSPYSPSQNSEFASPVSQVSGRASSLGSVNTAKVTPVNSSRPTTGEMGKKTQRGETSTSTKKTNDNVAVDKKCAEDIIISMSRAALKPHYHSGRITPQEYKEIMKKAISKIAAKTNGDISEKRVVKFINAYVEKVIMDRKT